MRGQLSTLVLGVLKVAGVPPPLINQMVQKYGRLVHTAALPAPGMARPAGVESGNVARGFIGIRHTFGKGYSSAGIRLARFWA